MSCTNTHTRRSLRDKAAPYGLLSLVEALESYAGIYWQNYRATRQIVEISTDFNERTWAMREAVATRRTLQLLLTIRREGLGR